MGPQEEGVTHTATPLGVSCLGIPRASEEALLKAGKSRTKDQRETRMLVEEVIPQIGIVWTREELIPATRIDGKFQSLKQQR